MLRHRILAALFSTAVALLLFAVSNVFANGTVDGWYVSNCSAVFPNFTDRGMDGWASFGESGRCWQYAEGSVSPSGWNTTGTQRGLGFQVNTLEFPNRGLYFKWDNCGSYLCGTHFTIGQVGTYLLHDGSLPSSITSLYDFVHEVPQNDISWGYARFYVWGGGYKPPTEQIHLDIGDIQVYDDSQTNSPAGRRRCRTVWSGIQKLSARFAARSLARVLPAGQ